MNRLLKRLGAEHRRLASMMDLLAAQARQLHADGDVDFFLIHEVLGYCAEYANVFHHPAEDRALSRLLARRPETLGTVNALRLQHGDLNQRTYALVAVVDSILADAPAARADVGRQIEEFVDLNQRHRRFEEDVVFPILIEALTARDWRAIETQEASARHAGDRDRERRHLRRMFRWIVVDGRAGSRSTSDA